MPSVKVGRGTIFLVEGDITMQETEAIVNAANSSLMGGGGVDGAIHSAGGPAILEECERIVARIGRLEPGHAVITTAGRMAARFVIHTVGPVWRGGKGKEPETLASCYQKSLKLALEEGIRTISFPSISTGAYGYPLDDAARVALKAVRDFLEANDGIDEVVFVLWEKAAYSAYENALKGLALPKKKR
jgi:O-acetyl-ADP-ribose deacetylase (regulator of RNase III)